mgnify:CR=1 FL=1
MSCGGIKRSRGFCGVIQGILFKILQILVLLIIGPIVLIFICPIGVGICFTIPFHRYRSCLILIPGFLFFIVGFAIGLCLDVIVVPVSIVVGIPIYLCI